ALAWRAFAAVNTFIGATLLNKGKAGSDSVVKTVLFFFYERAWAQVSRHILLLAVAIHSDL
ncbi:hypothetical protein EMIHUDRAFT_256536, partial [Emiliania huxleyi CCMP1516]